MDEGRDLSPQGEALAFWFIGAFITRCRPLHGIEKKDLFGKTYSGKLDRLYSHFHYLCSSK